MAEPSKDITLWNAFKKGESTAFKEIYRLYYAPLFLYGIKIVQDKLLIEDCIHELFTELYTSKSSPTLISIKAYIFKAFRYKLLYKIKQNKKNIAFEEINNDYGFDISQESFLITREMDEEKKNKIISCLSSLNKRQREIIYLRFYRNMSYEEISDLMDINYQASRNLLSNSLKALRKLLIDASSALFVVAFIFLRN